MRVLIAALALTAVAAQPAPRRRVPVFAGNGLVHVLVEIDGTVKTWGDPRALDGSPGLGDGTKPGPEVKEPRPLAGVRDVVDASVGMSQVLLLESDGTVLAWGDNTSCEVNGTDTKAKFAPVPVAALRRVKQVAAGYQVSFALLEDGTVWQWGGGRGDCPPPAKIDGLAGITQIAINDSSLALKGDGTVWGWGDNRAGELCDGTKEKRPRPFQLAGVSGVTAVAMGETPFFLLSDGTLRTCPGRKLPALGVVQTVKTTRGTNIVQLVDGTLRAWGFGWYGALGDGHGDQSSPLPKAPIGVGPVIAYYMETNGSAAFAVRADGTVMWWGVPAPPGGKTEFVLTPVPAPFTVLTRAAGS